MKPLRWLEIITLTTGLTILAVCLIPAESILGYIRSALVIVFMFFVPGNCLVNMLFRNKDKIDIIEKIVLSVALSFGIAGLIGLFLGLTPIGLNFISITASLSCTTLILAITAYILKNKDTKQIPNNKTVD
ncbi:MAG: DUF1616 domain-containing protein [Nitrososphaerota archaeon]|nr:DUF1616 domain-containing protein [Nitrososphaerota archaeon]